MTRATFGLGGHGLLIAPVTPCWATVTADNALAIIQNKSEVARIAPGERIATSQPTWRTPKTGQFGDHGPTLWLDDSVAFEDVFLRIDTGLGDSPWCALAPGFIHDLPPHVVLVSASPTDKNPFYELHLPGGRNEFISFHKQARPASAVVITPAPYQRVVTKSHLKVRGPDGSVRELEYTEVAYDQDGASWTQFLIVPPLHETASVIIVAQAHADHGDALFDAVKVVAATMAPLR